MEFYIFQFAASDHSLVNNGNINACFRSPTMAGGLFAIGRKFFEHVGTYDPGFEIWGGENLELSFKVCHHKRKHLYKYHTEKIW